MTFAFTGAILAQEAPEKRIFLTKRLISEQINVDGNIDDESWDLVEWQSDFTVHNPNNGDKPKRQTQFKVLYDDDFIYLAFKCWHEDISKIENRLGRRDNFPGDWVEVNIDSYFDKSTAFSFTISVSGVKGDEFITGNGDNWDTNWNPIWYADTKLLSDGWSAEMKIPLSQLRFGVQDEYTWGLNVMRRDFSADERSTWQWIPQNLPGWVSNYGELHGIKGLKPKKQLEIQPYTVVRARSFPKEEGNPFATGSDSGINVGVDGKIGLTSDITLDFTVNPDFGQVEADPSALALDGFQIFFDERRPFFVENSNLFSFQISNLDAGGPFGNDNLFYSRRIGSSPRGDVYVPDGAYLDYPDFTRILASAKVSGKTQKGLSIGLLESITAKEYAQISHGEELTTQLVEPLTNYVVGSISQDINEAESKVGFTFTALNRDLNDTGLEDQYHKSAYSGGLNLFHSWKNREWQLKGNIILSQVSGTTQKIQNTQESFEHYYQRPDADHLTVDVAKTSLVGHGGTLSISNYGGKDNISFQSGLTWRSPGLELNDLGFLNTADQINHVTWAGYRSPKPVSIFRSVAINANFYNRWTYGREHIYQAANVNAHFDLKNYWGMGGGTTFEVKDISPKALFGGPLLRQNQGFGSWFYVRSDSRKKVNGGFNTWTFRAVGQDKGALNVNNYNMWVAYQPNGAIRISMNPGYFRQNRAIQNVSSYEYQGDQRYITGRLIQETIRLSLRLSYSMTPNMTVQYWGQPFISKGNYSEFKYIVDPLARAYTDRFILYTSDQISNTETASDYLLDDDMDGVSDYSFSNPDFNFIQFRSNMVFRWEYKPGSELFLVWSQNNTTSGDPDASLLSSIENDLFGTEVMNTFLVKLTYRFY